MKKIISAIAITAMSVHTFAQITFDTAPPKYNFYKINTSDLGEKYVSRKSSSVFPYQDTLFIYNNDWSVYRVVTLPIGHESMKMYIGFNEGTDGFQIGSVSDKLFDNDSGIELLTETYDTTDDNYYLHVVNELGQVEYTFPYGTRNNDYYYLYKINNVFKLWYHDNVGAKIFNLPGTLPCDPCGMVNGMTNPGIGGELSGMKAYPNPFNQTLSIEYSFSKPQDGNLVLMGVDGKELKSIALNNQSDKLTLSTADLPKGMIIANLYGKNGNLISKKLVKIE